MAQEKVRVVIEVRGGNVELVYAGSFVEVVMVDWDNISAGDSACLVDPTPESEMAEDTAAQVAAAVRISHVERQEIPMSERTAYLSEYRWRRIPGGLRWAILQVLPRKSVVGQYLCTVQGALRAWGVPELADDLGEEIALQLAEARGETGDTTWRQAARDLPQG